MEFKIYFIYTLILFLIINKFEKTQCDIELSPIHLPIPPARAESGNEVLLKDKKTCFGWGDNGATRKA